MDQPVIPFDLARMFLGEHPPLFYAEILVRTVLVYVYALLMIRWIGGRGVAQLSMVEFLLVIALGSAVGDAMFYPDVPLLAAMAVITVVVGLNKVLDRLIVRFDRAKRIIDGRPVALVLDGRILPEAASQRDLGLAEIKAMLRLAGVGNLGELRAAYLEAGGGLSVFRRSQVQPGLSLLPPEHLVNGPPPPAKALAMDGQTCCAMCGASAGAQIIATRAPCPECGNRMWQAPEWPEGAESAQGGAKPME
ncbi:MAG: YetF domain-containing protein [Paracoccus sp. (in: a-proteobacteria)]|jgi:uncharacterized membrane protein YcaP (DUF421 family)|uniref:DUF421 domain-containing protein n=1 Tax=Paracoccus TaxID=265 RepID=UPI001FCF8881|nr:MULTISPECIES: YetF domain-containing protein [Paracoccus]QXI65150.1 hypothetical protein CP157_02932 [Paracoccus marcusii]